MVSNIFGELAHTLDLICRQAFFPVLDISPAVQAGGINILLGDFLGVVGATGC